MHTHAHTRAHTYTHARRPHTLEEGSLIVRVESGDPRVASDKWSSILHLSAGWDPYTLVEQGECLAKLSLSIHCV